ncbi:MAG: M14 family zinc carboxypeptidase [Pyrinomonadaceae bacterium]
MRILSILLLIVFAMPIIADAQSPKEFAAAWDESHISNIFPSNVRHKDIQNYVKKLGELGLKTREVGRSYGDREIYEVEWGKGPTKVFMWSQMHGDEPTATSGAIDMLAFLQTKRDKYEWIKKLEQKLTIRFVPMLNPDGAELFQRRNLQSIDINRDARNLQTPEGRLLKQLRDDWKPDFGFNLHNQNELTTVGSSFRQATISLLAVSGREDGSTYPGHERNKRICSLMIEALKQFIPGNIARYEDDYNPRAFGDMISAWGTPVILIETGGHHGKDEMFLIRLNFIALMTALQSMVDGTQDSADAKIYERLPFNDTGNIYNYIFRKANVINFRETATPYVADIAINRERRRQEQLAPVFVREVGDLSIFKGLEEIDASGYNVVVPDGMLRIGSRGHLLFYKKDRKVNWKSDNLAEEFPPDGEFLNGVWLKKLP